MHTPQANGISKEGRKNIDKILTPCYSEEDVQFLGTSSAFTPFQTPPRAIIMDAILDAIKAPDFQLNASTGEPFRLSQYQGRRHVVLVFNRGFT